jgi:2-polyprenyl-6-hydroxyphenyl methylase/3-demethylubiquinone-9 3-methyltransferase|tara:strand:- start:270 stop:980 length:711 start_codon:yes stop_codon:yes gene_type:complete
MKTKNLDTEEVKKFNDIAEVWWDLNGDFKPLHQINPLRLNYIQERCSLSGLKVLDVGCGGGILSEAMSNLGAEVIGIDASDKTIGVAQAHGLKVNSNVNYIQTTIEDLLEEGLHKNFDVITCLEMLEHVPDPSQIVKLCSGLLKDNGHAFFSTINRNPKSYLFAVIGAEYILNLLPKGTHDYSKFIKPSELASWLRSSNLSLQNTTGLSYNPLTDHYWLSSDVQVNYMMHTLKIES